MTCGITSWRPTYVELVDGRMVLSDAEEWRLETLARQVNRIDSLPKRRAWLEAFKRLHGDKEEQTLLKKMIELREAKR